MHTYPLSRRLVGYTSCALLLLLGILSSRVSGAVSFNSHYSATVEKGDPAIEGVQGAIFIFFLQSDDEINYPVPPPCDVPIQVTLTGSAERGQDYDFVVGSFAVDGSTFYVTVPAGYDYTFASFAAYEDHKFESSGTESVQLTAVNGGDYEINAINDRVGLVAESLTASTFTFRLIENAYDLQDGDWTIESSPDLENWSYFDEVTLDYPSAKDIPITDTTVSSHTARFFRAQGTTDEGFSAFNVGYCKVTVPARTSSTDGGYTLVANQFHNPVNNKVSTIFAGVPAGTVVSRMNANGTFTDNTYGGSTWTDPDMMVNPGQSVFVRNPSTNTTLTLRLFGRVPEGTLWNSAVVGFTGIASIVPQVSTLASTEYPPDDFDTIYVFNKASQQYDDIYTFLEDWYPDISGAPFPIGEGFLISTGSPKSWFRTFTVWD